MEKEREALLRGSSELRNLGKLIGIGVSVTYRGGSREADELGVAGHSRAFVE